MLDLFIASGKAVSTLVAILVVGCLLGYYPRPSGILTPATVKTMATMVMYVFSPCLLISTYSTKLTVALLEKILTMQCWCLIHVLVCTALGWLTLPAAAPSARLAGVYRVSLIFGNAASLPFLLLTTLVQREALRADPEAFNRGVIYCFSYLILWFPAIYSLGFEMLRPDTGAPAAAMEARAVLQRTLQQPPILATVVGVLVGLTPLHTLFWAGPGEYAPLEGMGAVVTLLGQGSIPSANIVLAGSLFSAVVELHGVALRWMGEEALPAEASGWAVLMGALSLFYRALRRRLGEGSGGSMVQLVDEAQQPAAKAPLPAPSAASSGAVAVEVGGAEAEPQEVFFTMRTMAVLIATRLLLCPAVCFALFYAAQSWGLPILASTDPMLTLVILIQSAMPSAQTLLVVASNVGNLSVGRALSLMFLVMYPIATLTLIPWLMIAISWAGI